MEKLQRVASVFVFPPFRMTDSRPNEEPKQPQNERSEESRQSLPNSNGLRRVTGVIRVPSPQDQLAVREVFAQEFAGPNIPLQRPEPAKPIEELLIIPETVQVAVTRAAVPREEVPTADTSEVGNWQDIAAENQPSMEVASDIAPRDAVEEADTEDIAPEIRREQDVYTEPLPIDPSAIMAPRVMEYDSAVVVPPSFEDAESRFLISNEDRTADWMEPETHCVKAPQVSESDLAALELLAKRLRANDAARAERLALEEDELRIAKVEALQAKAKALQAKEEADRLAKELAAQLAEVPEKPVESVPEPVIAESTPLVAPVEIPEEIPAEKPEVVAPEVTTDFVEEGDAEDLEEEPQEKLSYAQRIGMQIEDWICALGDFTIFACRVIWWLLRFPRRGTLLPCMHEIGIMSLPVIAMTGTFIGMVLAVQSYNQLKGFYLETRMGALINLSLVRELGPVLAATMLAGRIGSSMAAELGTMRVTEQIDALGSMGVNPIHYLVVPRFLSCMLLIPVLTIFADFMGIVGGAYFSVWIFHVDWHFYLTNSNKIVGTLDVFIGIFKSVFFGAAIGLIGCHRGFHSRAGAQGVGRAATEAFVFSFVTILLLDLTLGILIESLTQFLPSMPRQL